MPLSKDGRDISSDNTCVLLFTINIDGINKALTVWTLRNGPTVSNHLEKIHF
jgi:hypothetical protein